MQSKRKGTSHSQNHAEEDFITGDTCKVTKVHLFFHTTPCLCLHCMAQWLRYRHYSNNEWLSCKRLPIANFCQYKQTSWEKMGKSQISVCSIYMQCVRNQPPSALYLPYYRDPLGSNYKQVQYSSHLT